MSAKRLLILAVAGLMPAPRNVSAEGTTPPPRPQVLHVLCIAVALVFSFTAHAHTSPQQAIARITHQIQTSGPTVPRLVQRAIEYRTLNNYPAAKRDLDAALAIDPADYMALRELARVDLCIGDFQASQQAVDRALEHTPTGPSQSSLFALRAEVHQAAGRHNEALADINRALESDRPEVDWFIQRSRIQWTIRDYETRVQDLRGAAQRNPSIVIQYELTDALIDADHFDEALSRVETELTKCRDCAAWQIRRARIRQALGDTAGAKTDLETAIAKCTARLDEQRNSPLDLTTIIERATAYALLGDLPRAKHALALAQSLNADPWLTAQLDRMINGH